MRSRRLASLTGEDLQLSASFQQLGVNCVETLSPSRMRFTPCLSDLLPVVRETLKDKPLVRRFPGGELLRRLPDLTFADLKLELSNLRASTSSAPASLRVRVDTKISAR
ncbi:hypothetical protein [Polyangium sp. y55x31]|uniref:hypothetical protein n=1 Tax=Polyangium sp. y55x31 TaxID=3042688 RepID=UPI0024822C45|nr:hypothetical protein [Polyangium sp. y55x31]MDI1483612.1 hypothetical protein [Polyangium sp. y55x31]